jgi:hypothetical protein
MERLINIDSTVTQLWSAMTLNNPEDGGDMFFETSVLIRTSRYKVPEGICNIMLTLLEYKIWDSHRIVYEDFCLRGYNST